MIGALLGITGKLKALTDRLTAARAGYLDNLNTNLSALPAPASTALSTAQWTNARAGYLDVLNAGGIAQESTPMLDVPIAAGLIDAGAITFAGSILATASGYSGGGVSSSTSYVTVVTYTGAGVITFCANQQQAAGSYSSTVKITIDGVVVYEQATAATLWSTRCPIGMIDSGGYVAMESVPFKTSLLIEQKCSGGSNTSAVYYKYRKTA